MAITLSTRSSSECRDMRLDDAALFVTLEPCAPGARSERKFACTERIILARIKKVWIGIEDPDPTVAGRGIDHLRANGVEVQLFDRDLQQMIIDENNLFLNQALERAGAATGSEVDVRAAAASPLDGIAVHAGLADLSATALDGYGESVGLRGRDAVIKALKRQGLVRRRKNDDWPTKFGLILFGTDPRSFLPQAGLIATIAYADEQQESREFAGPLIEVPEQVEEWLRARLPNVIDRQQMRREERPLIPFEPIREGIVNALIHRDYEIAGAKCQFESRLTRSRSPVQALHRHRSQSTNSRASRRQLSAGTRSFTTCSDKSGLPRRPASGWRRCAHSASSTRG